MKPWWQIKLGPGWENRLDAEVEKIVKPLIGACEDGLKFLDSLPEDYLTAENTEAFRGILEEALAGAEGALS